MCLQDAKDLPENPAAIQTFPEKPEQTLLFRKTYR